MTWNILNAETVTVKHRIGISELIIDNHATQSEKQVARSLERIFAHIPLSTTKGLISSPEVAELLLKHAWKGDFTFRPVFKTLDTKNTTYLWGISVKINYRYNKLLTL